LPELTREQIEAIAGSKPSMDNLIREKIQSSFSFGLAATLNYKAALAVEAWIKSGQSPCGPPRLNPAAHA